jgi:hypothetical protein
VIISEAVRKRRECAQQHASQQSQEALETLKAAVRNVPPEPPALVDVRAAKRVLSDRLSVVETQAREVGSVAHSPSLTDDISQHSFDPGAPNVVQARKQRAELDAEADGIREQRRPLEASIAGLRDTHARDLTRWVKSILVEFGPHVLACFAPALRDAGRLDALRMLYRQTRITLFASACYAPADLRIQTAHKQLEKLSIIADDLDAPIPSLPDAWTAPKLPKKSHALVRHEAEIAAAEDAFDIAGKAVTRRIRELEPLPAMPQRDFVITALEDERDRAKAQRDALEEELDLHHSPWRAPCAVVLRRTIAELAGDLRDAHGAACVGLAMLELLARIARTHGLMWANRGTPALTAAHELVELLEGGRGEGEEYHQQQQMAAVHRVQQLAVGEDAARRQAERRPDVDPDILEERQALAARRREIEICRRGDYDGDDE